MNLEHLEKLAEATGIPLVLHGGSGIEREYVLAAVARASPRSTSAPRSASRTK